MQAVKGKDTGPELIVRRMIHGEGFRYRLHRRDLPGCPDMVFFQKRKIIFIHGCFWHGHDCARGKRIPKTNADYWSAKIIRNRARDRQILGQLCADGWDVAIVWECETGTENLRDRLVNFLG